MMGGAIVAVVVMGGALALSLWVDFDARRRMTAMWLAEAKRLHQQGQPAPEYYTEHERFLPSARAWQELEDFRREWAHSEYQRKAREAAAARGSIGKFPPPPRDDGATMDRGP